MCFIEADALQAFKQVEKIYAASGRGDRLVLDHFQGEHEINLGGGDCIFRKTVIERSRHAPWVSVALQINESL